MSKNKFIIAWLITFYNQLYSRVKKNKNKVLKFIYFKKVFKEVDLIENYGNDFIQ